MSIESSLASVWEFKLWCSCALVFSAGARLAVLYVSKIPLKLNNNKNIKLSAMTVGRVGMMLW